MRTSDLFVTGAVSGPAQPKRLGRGEEGGKLEGVDGVGVRGASHLGRSEKNGCSGVALADCSLCVHSGRDVDGREDMEEKNLNGIV